jgi:hypothetical protein
MPNKSKKNKTTKTQKVGNGNGKAKQGGNNQQRSGITPKVSVPGGGIKVDWGSDQCVISNTDFLRTLDFADDDKNRNFPGAVLFGQMLNPWRVVGGTLTQFANLFQRFCFLEARIRYVPAVPATTAGQFIICWDTDPTWAPLGSSQGVIRAMTAHKGRAIFHVFDNMSSSNPKSLKAEYYCDVNGQDIRLNNQSVFWVALLSPIVNSVGDKWTQPVGSFFLDWKVKFRTLRINEMQRQTVGDTVTYLVAKDTGYDFVDYRFVYAGGARISTQTAIIVPRTISQTVVGVERGVVYYYGTKQQADVTQPNTTIDIGALFGTLRAAQQFDTHDLIDLDVLAGDEPFIDMVWIPVGPAVGIREASGTASTKSFITGSSRSTTIGDTPVNITVDDPNFQAKEYLVKFNGTSTTPSASGDINETALIYGPDAETICTVAVDEALIMRCATPTAIKNYFLLTEVELDIIYGFEANKAAFLGLLVTLGGLLVRAVSVIGTSIRIANAVKREMNETDVQFFRRIDPNPQPLLMRQEKGYRCSNFFYDKLAGNVKPTRIVVTQDPRDLNMSSLRIADRK